MRILKVLRGVLRRYYRSVTVLPPRPDIRPALRECAGQWIAVDRRTGEVRAVKATPYELAAYLRDRSMSGVDVMRAPDPSEPELVGLG
jgi:hypothetical protein